MVTYVIQTSGTLVLYQAQMASVLHGTWGIILTLTVPCGTIRVKVSNHPGGRYSRSRSVFSAGIFIYHRHPLLGKLPVVLGALSALFGVLGGAVDGLHDDSVLLVEGDGLDELVHLVPHLGGGQVVVSGHGGLTGGAGHAAQLVLVTAGVEKETHA